ncbi:hypothetical protein ACHHYP_14799, partial [Achlya hypogyna]
MPPTLGASLQYTALNSIPLAIAGFRHAPALDACDRPWIFAQYCFLDFNRTWEMANSIKRQARCTTIVANAAVYLEAVLRNLDWPVFEQCWGDAFDTAIAADLRQSTAGQRWLASLTPFPPLTLDEEIAYWSAHGLTHYTTQWQTYKTIGLFNSYTVQNAYGMTYSLAIQAQNG